MSTGQPAKKIEWKDLPVALREKYKHSLIFAPTSKDSKSKEYDLQRLLQRKAQKEKTIEERLEEFTINPTEQKYLMKVFRDLAEPHAGKFFTVTELHKVLQKLGLRLSRAEVERMLWEFDEDLDKKISEKEFINMYKKCTLDKAGAESKNLFHLAQFLMYCRPGKHLITVEDTLELLYVREKDTLMASSPELDDRSLEKEVLASLEVEIQAIFDSEKTAEGLEKEIDFKEYLQRLNRRAVQKRQQDLEVARSALKYGNPSQKEP